MKIEGANLRSVIVELIPPSGLDELRCRDGEVENGSYLFEGSENGAEGVPEAGEADQKKLRIGVTGVLSAGAEFLCMHRIEGVARRVHAVIQSSEGRIRYMDMNAAAEGERDISYVAVDSVRRCVASGDFLVCLTDSSLLYAYWNRVDGRYVWLGAVPSPPIGKCDFLSRGLPPYSINDGDLPVMEIAVYCDSVSGEKAYDWLAGRNVSDCPEQIKEKVRAAIREKMTQFLAAVKNAGFHYGTFYVSYAWRLDSTRCWNASLPSLTGADETLKASIVSALYADGVLRVRLRLSRAPFIVTPVEDLGNPDPGWSELLSGVNILTGEDEKLPVPSSMSDVVWIDGDSRGFTFAMGGLPKMPDMSPALSTMDVGRIPDDIQQCGGRIFGIFGRGEVNERNILTVSDTVYPFAWAGESEISGGRLLRVEHSLRALSSGQFGDFPLYAFSNDGIRALTPSGGAFKDVQLISRDIPLSPDGFAAAADGVCFISSRGVMRIEGTSLTCLSDKLKYTKKWTSGHRPAYLYENNALVVYAPGEEDIEIYDFATSKWSSRKLELTSGLRSHHYAWPEIWWWLEDGIGQIYTADRVKSKAMNGESDSVVFTTRSIKFGTPFEEKKLVYVEAVWPDGKKREIKVFGANTPGIWHCLGRNSWGRLRLRGTGWRLFKFESRMSKTDDGENKEKISFVKPLIYCKICEK